MRQDILGAPARHTSAAPSLPALSPGCAGSSISFRLLDLDPAGASDLAAFATMVRQHHSYFHDNDLIGLPSTKADLKAWLNRFGRRIVVAGFSDDGQCLGFGGADRYMSLSDAVEKTSIIATLFYGVLPRAQRRGLAHAMVRLVVERLGYALGPQARTCHIGLQCRVSNTASQSVAAAIGMVRCPERDFDGALSHSVPRHQYLGYEAQIADVLGPTWLGFSQRRGRGRCRDTSGATSDVTQDRQRRPAVACPASEFPMPAPAGTLDASRELLGSVCDATSRRKPPPSSTDR